MSDKLLTLTSSAAATTGGGAASDFGRGSIFFLGTAAAL